MSAAVLYMSMSLDGYITGPNASLDNPLGDGGMRLHDWIFADRDDTDFKAAFAALGPINRQVAEELMTTRAVVAGRGTFEPAGGWDGDHHDGVPIYIVSRHPKPDWASGWSNVNYVSDLEVAIREAKTAAGDQNVLVHGASIAQRALAAGLLDELQLHLVPVLFGNGRRLFEHPTTARIELVPISVLAGERGVTHLRYAVKR